MTPLFVTLHNRLSLKIIPDTRVQMEGHPILSYNYSIFLNPADEQPADAPGKGIKPADANANDPNYLGYITFEQPGKLFTYTSVQGQALDADEVEEIIAYLSHVRDNPALWRETGNM